MGLFDFFSSDLAIDLGTANTLIIKNEKIVVDEPSIIAIDGPAASGKSTVGALLAQELGYAVSGSDLLRLSGRSVAGVRVTRVDHPGEYPGRYY